ncbi:MAG: hypothetical protein HYZ11_08285 [Candidatus Tectomicrobia bacterium]|uniref:Uncharacterized protein n=1 Tax=Tectimicrobiota bacterium TaxID=2528274 RepID=A0A932MMF2_UNCTE|nr:hypothetical protein [Candidatus Tectomicrobia bacterium]
MSYYLIDGPLPMAPLSEWEDFRQRLEKLPSENPEVAQQKTLADEMIARLKLLRRSSGP